MQKNKIRKDSKGHALHTGEYERPDAGAKSRYMYVSNDALGNKCYIYAEDLPQLRQKEEEIHYYRHDKIDIIAAGRLTVNDLFDRMMSLKVDLKDNVKANYIYMYNKFIRDSFGMRKISDVKYSDAKAFYYGLILDKKMSAATVETIHTLLHPTFDLAIKDGYIRNNPTDGIVKEIKKGSLSSKTKRVTLTEKQTKAFFDFIKGHEVFGHWYNMLIILYGSGMRIGELVGIRWEDIDLERNVINVNHNVVYFRHDDGKSRLGFHDIPKTDAGIRDIPMFDFVRTAVLEVYELQKEIGFSDYSLDGHTGFVFTSRYGSIYVPQVINKAICRIIDAYNTAEIEKALKANRSAEMLPHFSCHSLRHTICARLCEVENNVKFIQEFMGHADITTTMNIYAEFSREKKLEKMTDLNTKISL